MLDMITSAPNGFVPYKTLCDTLGDTVANSMIQHHLLHLRPNQEYYYDLSGVPDDEPVVTAESPTELFAMKLILDELQPSASKRSNGFDGVNSPGSTPS